MRLNWRFRPKLTLLYTVLFLLVFVPAIALVKAAVVNGVTRSVERELEASGAVFNQILALRGSQLEETATVLAADFGFRAAIATQDVATVESALFNIVDRVGASRGLVVDLEGQVFAATDASGGTGFDYARVLDEEQTLSTAGILSGRPHILVMSPIRAPLLIGWVVFALELNEATTAELESLSALPLQAQIVQGATLPGTSITEFAPAGPGTAQVSEVLLPDGPALALHVSVPVADGSEPVTLVLTHAMAVALQPYQQMLWGIAALGVIGVALLAGGSWFLADRVTQPLAALTGAVKRLKDGQRAAVQLDATDEFGDLAAGFNTMSEQIASREAAITHMAMHDSETGLPNRLHLQERLGELDPAAAGSGIRTVLIGVRVKRFANVRAAIGYELAARFLNRIASRLVTDGDRSRCARVTVDTLAVIRRIAADEDFDLYCDQVRASLSSAVSMGTMSVDVNLCVAGLDLDGSETPEQSVQCLELALDHAIAQHSDTIVYSSERIPDPTENLTLMGDMRTAIAANQISLHYQPKVDIRTGRISEVEALLRWTHPERGFVPPDVFVEMAEETGHIVELSEWVVERALTDQRAWRTHGLDIAMGINMSGRLLANRGFTDFVIAALARHQADPNQIVLEITETAVMDNPAVAVEQLHRLRDAGFALSIDDYGTGLSSLSYLKQLPVTELKIDKSFVLDLASNVQDRVLVRSTAELAHSLGLKVTAEGVEDAASFATLQLFGCDYAQGYFISKALPSEDFTTFATDWNSHEDPVQRYRAI